MADNVNADLGGNYQAAEQLFNLLNEENFDMAGVSRVLTDNPGILSDDAFVAKLSLTDLNLIDEKNVDELSSGLSKFSQNLQNTNRVLSNLQKVASSDTVVSPDDVSAIVNAHLPNGETIGTQTIKNMNYLNALQNTPHIDSSLLQKVAMCVILLEIFCVKLIVRKKVVWAAIQSKQTSLGSVQTNY